MRRLLPFLLLLTACGGGSALTGPSTTAAPATTEIPTTTAAPTTTEIPTTTAAPASPRVLLSIPVGDGIEYQAGGEDLPPDGPSLITADRTGGLHIYDPVDNRILSFTADGDSVIDLGERDILGVTAVSSADDHLVVVEVYFAPLRQRVHRIGFDGAVLQSIDLPAGFGLEDGLSGVFAGDGDQVFVEYAGGASYAVWHDDTGTFERVEALSIAGTSITGRSPDLVIGGTTITADLAGDLGGLRYLGTAADGTHVLVRDEVQISAGAFDVLTTVEWYTSTGAFVASARVPPLQDQAIGAPPGLTLLPDGRVAALVALPAAVEVIELAPLDVRITRSNGAA